MSLKYIQMKGLQYTACMQTIQYIARKLEENNLEEYFFLRILKNVSNRDPDLFK